MESKPAVRAVAVTPNDSVDLPQTARSLWVGVSGTVVAILAEDTVAVTLVGVQGILPARVRRVLATGTTATSIVALY